MESAVNEMAMGVPVLRIPHHGNDEGHGPKCTDENQLSGYISPQIYLDSVANPAAGLPRFALSPYMNRGLIMTSCVMSA